MMRAVAILLTVGWITLAAAAEPRATPEEARAMCENAARLIRTAGIEEASLQIMQPGGPFHDRELFVVVMDPSGTVLAHGARENYVGRNMIDLTDIHGVRFVAQMLEIPTDGFIEYAWQNPLSGAVENKRSWVVRRPDFVAFVGAYAATGP